MSTHRVSPRNGLWTAAGFFLLSILSGALAAEPGFVSLFDGKTLEGWAATNMTYWSVKEGAITASCAGTVTNHSYLVWQGGKPADFELKLKFRILGDSNANSGVQFRSEVLPDGYVTGYQADITRYEKHCAILYDETPKRGMLANRGERTVIDAQGKRTTERFGDPHELWQQIKIDDWNDYDIVARGQTMSARVNGRLMWEVTDREAGRHGEAPGVIALQIHKGPPMTVQFKDTFLKTLPPARAGLPNPFFPFCIDWHDAKKRSFAQQAEMLKELGYPGVGHIWLDKVEERLATLDAAGLKLFQITMTVDVAPGKIPYDAARFKEVLALIKGRHVQFCVTLNGMKPSDPSVDPHAVKILREMSDLAKDSGAQLLLYPHQRSWVERIEDSIRVADQVNRPNVGVMFNLCHWLRVDPSRDYEPLLKRAMPRLWAISINGADERDDKPGWARYIQPLDSGSFDVGALLETLQRLGYQGPIGLQCFGIGGDAREHLARSMAKWQELGRQLAETK